MSELFQPGQHPDADQLSAFAEQALPAHERQSVLEHLAHCVACREIAYLAGEAEFEELAAAGAAAAQVPSARKSRISGWFSGWNLAWAAGAAVACLIILAVELHLFTALKSGETPSTVASGLATSKTPPVARRTTPGQEPIMPGGKATQGTKKSVTPRPDVDVDAAPVTSALNSEVVDSAILTGRDAAELVKMAPAPAASAGKSSSAGIPVGSQSAGAASRSSASTGTVVSGADAEVPADTAEISATLNNELVDTAKLSQKPPKLPSHFAAVSTVSKGRVELAIDSAGSLFASKDAGKHWTAVSPQWTGRAVQVAFVTASRPEVRAYNAAPLNRAAIAAPALADKMQSETPSAASIGNSTVSGIVTDQTGARISGAKVTLARIDSAERRDVTTNQNGSYAIDRLVPGEYALEVTAKGFAPSRQTGIEVSASQPTIADVALRVGSEAAAVTVVSEGSTVETKSIPVSTSIKGEPAGIRAAVFQLTTDSGAIWTSSDGRHWKSK